MENNLSKAKQDQKNKTNINCDYDYDLFVIGAGSGGVRASRMAAATGAKVAVAEMGPLGGTCVNLGCVPKKLMVYASHYSEDFHESNGYGWDKSPAKFNWKTLIKNKDQEILRLNNIYGNLLENTGVDVIKGKATITSPNSININNKNITAAKILITTGGWPSVPDIPGKEHAITSNEVFHLKELPNRILIVGGGYIAVEFAGIFNGLGSKVTQSYRKDVFLRGFDNEIRHHMAQEMAKKGVNLLFNSHVESIEKLSDNSLKTKFKDGSEIITDQILYATGRHPNIQDLNLDKVGVELTKSGYLKVDEFFQTSVKSIYSLGDIIGTPELTPVALAQAMAFVSTNYKNTPKTVDYTNLPTAVFCQPNIGTVGLTEEQAREKFDNIDIYKSQFRHLKHTLSGSEEKTFMKLIVNKDDDKVLGAHMAGAEAGEIIQGLGVALKAGATKSVFDQTIGVHPSAAEEFVTMRSPIT